MFGSLDKLKLEQIDYANYLLKFDKKNLDYTLDVFKKMNSYPEWNSVTKQFLVYYKEFFEEEILKDEKISENDKKILKKIFEKRYKNLEKELILNKPSEILKFVINDYKNAICSIFSTKK